MATTQVTGPYPIFTDLDGTPLDDGYLYIGEINQDPETNPILVFWDANLTIAASQPIRTTNGYAWRNGTPGLIYTGGPFSITIRNKREEFVLYSPVGYGFDPAAVSASVVQNDFVGDGVTVNFTLSASPSTKLATSVFINGVYQEKGSYSLSGNVLTFTIAPPLNSGIEVMSNETGVIGSTNASLVSYTAGFAGAVAQTVQTKLEQTVSVMDFGAVGDGVVDDYAAITAAILTGKSIYFPSTYTFLVSDTLIPEPDTAWFGYGATVLGQNNDPVIARIEADHAAYPGNKTLIKIFGLKVNGGGFDGPAVKFTKVSNIDLIDMEIFNRTAASGVGIELEEVYWWEIIRPYIYDCALHCIHGTDTIISGSNQGGVYGGRVIGNNQAACIAIKIKGSQGLKIVNVDVEGSGNGLTGIQLQGCEGAQINGCYIELWTDRAIDLSLGGNRRVVITSNVVNSGVLSAAGGVIELDTAGTVNLNVAVSFNRGADLAATQTLVQIGNCDVGYEFNNDPANARPTSNIPSIANGAYEVAVLKQTSAANITLAPGAQATGFITVYGAQRGDLVAITHTDTAPGERFWLSAQVVAPDTLEWVLEAIDAVSLAGSFSVQVSQQ
jgi:hypothetical protein